MLAEPIGLPSLIAGEPDADGELEAEPVPVVVAGVEVAEPLPAPEQAEAIIATPNVAVANRRNLTWTRSLLWQEPGSLAHRADGDGRLPSVRGRRVQG
jgi:hypothetical protein